MNKGLIRLSFFISAAVAVFGALEEKRTGAHGSGFAVATIGAGFALAFGRMLFLQNVLEPQTIKLGSELLPPLEDIASVLVHGEPLPEAKKQALLKAIVRARRSPSCGKISKTLPFQIADHWGGTWDLEAYEEVGGIRGFSLNRVFYAGAHAAVVADCVGL